MVPGGQPDGVGVGGGRGQRVDEPEDGGQVREVVVAAVRLAPGADDGGPLGARGGGVAGQRGPGLEADRRPRRLRSLAREPTEYRSSAMTQPPPPPGWYPDPAGGAGARWWDGQGWTEHVQQARAARSRQHAPPPPAPPRGRCRHRLRAALAAPARRCYEQPVLVVNQKTKLIELTNEYAVFDGNGQQIGAVVQVGQSALKKALRFVSNLDQFLTHRLEVRDATRRRCCC